MTAKYIFATLAVALLLGVGFYFTRSDNDPYDPVMGPRNPRPAAERYLATRSDIPDSEKRALLASEPCSTDVLNALVDSTSREVRSLVAINPSVTEPISRKLSTDTDAGVRQYVASNRHTSYAILQFLKNDPDQNVVWSLDHNPAWLNASTSTEVIK